MHDCLRRPEAFFFFFPSTVAGAQHFNENEKSNKQREIIRQLKKGRERGREAERGERGAGELASERASSSAGRKCAVMLQECWRGGIVGVTAPFFTAIIRASCQRQSAAIGWRSREGGRGGSGGGGQGLIKGEIIQPLTPATPPPSTLLPHFCPPSLPPSSCVSACFGCVRENVWKSSAAAAAVAAARPSQGGMEGWVGWGGGVG